MGVVYICIAERERLPVAMKTFQERYLSSKHHQELFKREAQAWVEMERHPYIVRAYLVEEIEGHLFIVLEYVAPDDANRNTLTHYLRELSLVDILKFSIQFCYGMEYAYSKGLEVHCDIKPDNIMITRDRVVKITDFGLAKLKGEAGGGGGTHPYMAPEQFEGKADKSSDIYGFGITLYQMISRGKLPFIARSDIEWYSLHKSAKIPEVASPLFSIVERCMRRRTPHFDSFLQLREELEGMLLEETGEKIAPPKEEELEAWELIGKGLSLSNLGIHKEAISCFERALEINPNLAEAWCNKGADLFKSGRAEEAISCYDKALEINPRYANAWVGKGGALAKLGRTKEAISCCDKALEINPRYAVAWCNKGGALVELGRAEEAISCCDKALEINPRYAVAWCNKGAALVKLGRTKEAISCCDKALEINPSFAEAWYNKGFALFKLDKAGEAISCCDKALEINPRFAEAWCNKGNALFKLDKAGEAISCFERALAINPRYAEAWCGKGGALAELDRAEESIFCLKRFIELAPDHPMADRIRQLIFQLSGGGL
jgi:tetratricopeptide (TPR) repeat protein